MKKFVPTLKIEGLRLEVAQRATDFVVDSIMNLPPRFKAREYGPVIALPVFVQQMIIEVMGRYSNQKIKTEGFNKINMVLSELMGYKIIPGYELAIVVFFPSEGAINPNGIYRIEFDQTKYLPE